MPFNFSKLFFELDDTVFGKSCWQESSMLVTGERWLT